MNELREGWFRPSKHYLEHNSHRARITREALTSPIKYGVFIKSLNDWTYSKAFTDLNAAMDAAETQLGLSK